jgi:hypothetical protein
VKARTIGVALLTVVLAFPPSVFADNITWQGGDPGHPNSFSIADNWTSQRQWQLHQYRLGSLPDKQQRRERGLALYE